VDVTAASTGSSATSSTAAVTTTNATDLLFGANVVQTQTSGPGSGFTRRLLTSPDGDIAEDRMVTATGSYSVTAPLSSAGQWIMQMVALRTPVVVGDTQPPTAPSGLTATGVSGTQINLGWTASVDNVGVTGYLIERCQGPGCNNFAQVATTAATTYSDTGLTNATTYSYRVRATDAAGNLSGYSNVASATTFDTQPPTAPSGLTAAAASGSQINLSWAGSNDNVGVTGYLIEHCQGVGCSNFAQVATTATTAYNDTGLTNATTYSYRVRATDAAGNLSGYSNVASATTLDTQPPTAPSNLAATTAGGSQINLSWTASADNVGVTQYLVERCQDAGCVSFAQIGTSNGTTFSNTGLAPNTSYSYRVRATDVAGNLSGYSNVASAVTQNPDTQPPSDPSNLTAAAVGGSQINLSWTASTDNVGVTQYLVERCQGVGCTTFEQVGTSTGTTLNNTGLTNATSYSYRVRATDAAGNLSGYSNIASATTPDTQPPTAPSNLTAAAAGGSQINLNWMASADNVV
jgi:chitodextrinase